MAIWSRNSRIFSVFVQSSSSGECVFRNLVPTIKGCPVLEGFAIHCASNNKRWLAKEGHRQVSLWCGSGSFPFSSSTVLLLLCLNVSVPNRCSIWESSEYYKKKERQAAWEENYKKPKTSANWNSWSWIENLNHSMYSPRERAVFDLKNWKRTNDGHLRSSRHPFLYKKTPKIRTRKNRLERILLDSRTTYDSTTRRKVNIYFPLLRSFIIIKTNCRKIENRTLNSQDWKWIFSSTIRCCK